MRPRCGVRARAVFELVVEKKETRSLGEVAVESAVRILVVVYRRMRGDEDRRKSQPGLEVVYGNIWNQCGTD